MKKKEKSLPIGFQLARIDTEQFAILEEVYNPETETSINVGLQFSAHPQKKGIGVHFGIQFKHINEVFLLLKTVCYFEIDPDNWDSLMNDNEESITLPKGFAGHLSVITVGTTRGILYEKLKEEPLFNQFILPTINVSRIVKEDIELEIA